MMQTLWIVLALLPVQEAKPEEVLVLLEGGERISGTMVVKEVVVDTAYGELVVPAGDVHKIVVGKSSRPELVARIADLLAKLGADEFKEREAAMGALREMGRLVEPELRAALDHGEPEVRQRAEKILEEIEEDDPDPDPGSVMPGEDTVVTEKFTICGRLRMETFQLETPFGILKFGKEDVRTLYLSPPRAIQEKLRLDGSQTVSTDMVDTKVQIAPGSRVEIRASGTIFLQNWGGEITPDGSSNWGRFNNQFAMGALVGRIGKHGPLFLVGRGYLGTSDRTGTLYLGLALNNAGQTNGDFLVRIEVRPKE
jgi:hypothetical protein